MTKNFQSATVTAASIPEVGRPIVIPQSAVGFRPSIALLVGAVAVISMLALNALRRPEYTGDEGFYGVTALNMLHAPSYILRPSYYPAGDFNAEKDAFAHPPFNSYFYAISLWLSRGSMVGPEIVNAVSFALLLLFSYRLLRAFDSQVAIFAVLLLVASPSIIFYYSLLEAEPLLCTSGIGALYFALRAQVVTGPRRYLFLSGLLLGLAFALKLWLCGPLALAVLAALGIRALQSGGRLHQVRRAAMLFCLGAVIPAGAHLLSIAIFYPGDLSFWLKNIYFGIFTSGGISGSKLAGAGVPSDWIHPFWYYGAALYREDFFLVPLILLAFGSAVRDKKLNSPVLWIILIGIAGLLPLSVIKVKEPLYVLSCSIFLFFLAAICASALLRRIAAREAFDRFSSTVAPLAILGLLLAIPLAYAKGIQAGKITGAFAAVHSIVFAAILAAFFWSRRTSDPRVVQRMLYGACTLAVVLGAGYGFFAQRPRDRIISHLIQPSIKENSPGDLSFVASNFKCYQFYSFRRGCYWHELALDRSPDALLGTPEFKNVRAFIIDPDDLANPRLQPWLQWLEKNAREKTSELNSKAGRVSGVRVFVRNG